MSKLTEEEKDCLIDLFCKGNIIGLTMLPMSRAEVNKPKRFRFGQPVTHKYWQEFCVDGKFWRENREEANWFLWDAWHRWNEGKLTPNDKTES